MVLPFVRRVALRAATDPPRLLSLLDLVVKIFAADPPGFIISFPFVL